MAKGKFAKAKKRRFWPFLVGMVVYAAVFLTLVYFGLGKFWDYIEAYELSRPINTIDGYVKQLNEEDVWEGSADMIGQIDHNIQSEEDCRRVLSEAVAQGISYAKKTSECTDTRLVYVLRSGSRVIGSVTMDTVGEDEYGFAKWQVTDTVFDMSYLIGQRMSITVPEDYPVSVNGAVLDSSYITVNDILYERLDAFYDEYDLPVMVTYEAGPFLGEAEMTVSNPAGEPVVIDGDTNYEDFLNNCTEQETPRLEAFAEEFIDRYVAFTGSAFKSSEKSFAALMEYVVAGSELATRMGLALEGLEWAQSRGDELVELTVNHLIKIEDGLYLCDVTYQVDTTGREGVVRTTNSAQFIIVETADGLKVDTLIAY